MDFDELMTYIEEILAHLFTGDDIVDAFNMIDADDNGEVTDLIPFTDQKDLFSWLLKI